MKPEADKPSHPADKTIFFVENLTARCWLKSVVPWLFKQFETGSCPRSGYAIESSAPGMVLARFFARFMGMTIEPLEFQLNQIKDRQGLHARIRIQLLDIDQVQMPILESREFLDAVESRSDAPRLALYIAKAMAVTSLAHERDNLFRALLVTRICDWKMRAMSLRDTSAAIFMEHRPWFDRVQKYASKFRFEVFSVDPTPSRTILLKNISPECQERLREIRYGGLSGLLFSHSHPRVQQRPVAVEYYGQLNLDRPELHSDFILNQYNLIDGEKVNAVFGLAVDPLDADKLEELAKHKMGAIVTHPAASKVTNISNIRHPGAKFVLPSPRVPSTPEVRWLQNNIATYDFDREYWEKLFEVHGTKLFLTWNKFDVKACAIADAVERVGGISLCFQRSHESNPCLDVTSVNDVNFIYGPLDVSKEHPLAAARCHVVVGFLGGHRFAHQRVFSDQLRAGLRKNGAERILSFFDENSSDDGRWYYGHSIMREAYGFLLERVLENSWLGLVLKPKVPRTLRRRLGPVAALLEQAEKTGRCHVLEGGTLHGPYPPPVAAMASDLAIHGHLWAGSAAVEAVLAGTPTLLIDKEGWHASPLYELGLGRVVFTEWSRLWEACRGHFADPSSIPGFGRWDSVLDDLDPFRDGRAAERMGMYVRWLLEGLEAGRDRLAVIDEASERYREQWGRDKVIDGNGRVSRDLSRDHAELVQTN